MVEKTDLEIFGEVVKSSRLLRKWSQEALAIEAFSNGDRKSYVSKIENGKQQNITTTTVKSLAVALDIDPEDIPSSLRWPEADASVRNSTEIMQDIYDQVALLVGKSEDSESREEVLLALTEKYTKSTTEDFQAAIKNISDMLEEARIAKRHDALSAIDKKDLQKLHSKLADIELNINRTPAPVNRKDIAVMATKSAAALIFSIVFLIFSISIAGTFKNNLIETTLAEEGQIWSLGDCYKPDGCPGVRISRVIRKWNDEPCDLPGIFGRCSGPISFWLTGRRYIKFDKQDEISDIKLSGPFRIETRDPYSIYEQLAETYPDCFEINKENGKLHFKVHQVVDVCRNSKRIK